MNMSNAIGIAMGGDPDSVGYTMLDMGLPMKAVSKVVNRMKTEKAFREMKGGDHGS